MNIAGNGYNICENFTNITSFVPKAPPKANREDVFVRCCVMECYHVEKTAVLGDIMIRNFNSSQAMEVKMLLIKYIHL